METNEKKFNIICLSNQFFDDPLKTNKWHIMTRLAAAGHNVIFVDPPTRFAKLKKLIKKEISILHFLIGMKRHPGGNLVVYSPLNFLNFKPFSAMNLFVQVLKLTSLLRELEERKTVLWIYHFDYPDLQDLIKKLKYDLLIYDLVDEYSAFPEYKLKASLNSGVVRFFERMDDFFKVRFNQKGLSGKAWVEARESWLIDKADLVFASAPGLVLKAQKLLESKGKTLEKVSYLPNSGDYIRFKDSKKYKYALPEDIRNIPRPRVLTAGAIDSYKMDLSLIEKCAKSSPNLSFILIGPTKVSDPNVNLDRFKELKNVYFLGTRRFEDLPKYYAGADCFFIPYNLNDYTIGGCFPVKFHEALAAGLPVVVTNLPCYRDFSDVCYIAKDSNDFVNLIQKALREDSDLLFKKRQEIAKANSWEVKVSRELSLINGFFERGEVSEAKNN